MAGLLRSFAMIFLKVLMFEMCEKCERIYDSFDFAQGRFGFLIADKLRAVGASQEFYCSFDE
jgi:hypothetical protein